MSFTAFVENVTVFSRAYYWQDVDCTSGISSGAAWLSENRSKMKWIQMRYGPPLYVNNHSCNQMSTSSVSDWYGRNTTLGGTYQDEARSTANPCWTGFGTSYTGSMII